MNSNHLLGFKQEIEKRSGDLKSGVEGLALGALLGAGLSALGTEALRRLVVRNRDIAIIAGAMMGGTMLGSAGFVLGGKNQPPAEPKPVNPPPYTPGPPVGVPLSSIRVIP